MTQYTIDRLKSYGVVAKPVDGKEWPLLTHLASGNTYDLNDRITWIRDYLADPSMIEYMLYHLAKD